MNTLAILNVLMNTEGYITTTKICQKVGCDRRTVYQAMDVLEVNGFAIDVQKVEGYYNANKYKYVGLRGLNAKE